MSTELIIAYISFLTPALLYSILIGLFIYGWYKTPIFKSSYNIKASIKVSIVIPVRNEESTIEKCLVSIIHQNASLKNMQIIISDDHSEDRTQEICKIIKDRYQAINICIFSNPPNAKGKKQAIENAVNIANGDLIITTDADTTRGPEWLSSIIEFYQQEKPRLIIGPVYFKEKPGFFNRFQSLEFISLIGTSAGAAAINKPIMCNGANLIYEKKAFQDVHGFLDNENQVSGDDIFLMMKISRKFGASSVKFLKAPDAAVQTPPEEKLTGFINQRLRWVSKSQQYRDGFVILTAISVYLFNFLLILSLILAFISINYLPIAVLTWVIKFGIDYPILKGISKFFDQRHLLRLYIPIQLTNILYTLFAGIAGHIIPFKWKNR